MTVPETPSPLDLDRLEALAEKATPGPWVSKCPPWQRGWVHGPLSVEVADCFHAGNAPYIAALSPEVVRALVSEARIGRLAIDARTKQLAWENCDPAKSGEFFRPYEAAEKALETAIEEADRAR